MSIDTVNNDSAPQGISLDPSKRTDADRQEIKRLAQQFEAMLMTQMLREMRRSMLDDDEDKENGFGAAAMTDTADVELGGALSRSGGIGLTDNLLKAFERQITGVQDQHPAAAKEQETVARPSSDQPPGTGPLILSEVTASAPCQQQIWMAAGPVDRAHNVSSRRRHRRGVRPGRQGCGRWRGFVCRRPERLRQHGGDRSRRRPPNAVRSPVAGTRSRRRRRERRTGPWEVWQFRPHDRAASAFRDVGQRAASGSCGGRIRT